MALTDEERAWFSGIIEQLAKKIGQLDSKIEQQRVELKADIERVETSLLSEFHKSASPMDARVRTHAATLRALDLESLSDRVKNLEKPPN